MALGQNGVLRYDHFDEFFSRIEWPIDFKLGLYIKVNVNARQNKFEVHISNHWLKWPLVGTK